ncbi:N-acetylmuramoyl-L-alanine amidase family protein [Paenibacillus silvae]|uniref:N-acetylmuramoyl-L-alanine amidase family protein n=1 Tax=Paenibacillus silvae TaxID=1325358 RepID=UPI002003888E|nr:N-acetylmuramoyl-L-alanine amidase family protein [Paenibacillus silvae]MCK6076435.1 N-acetylmuramoyl-L-alanine amidase family protein [Paenibacillus silvae]MCK6150862.1 N-acetylmuramoyl-L-alanine amidase family protein [Paenibacillus silvae]MCK6269122.1 N-acetylmuramoyl-L-alanine amidase family protein [Paenibacillus silvae]
MKKWLAAVVFVLFLCLFPMMAHAERVPSIMLDGIAIDQKTGAPAENIGKTVMVPIRIVSENLGYDVKWEKATQTVHVQKGSSFIEMTAGKDAATVNGNVVNLDAPPLIKQGTTLVPLRFVGEGMGLQVGWDNGTKTVSLFSIPPVVETESDRDPVDTPAPVGSSELQSISYSGDRLIVATSGSISPKVSSISGPERIVVDLPNTTFSQTFVQGQASSPDGSGQMNILDSALVSKVRFAMFSSSPSTVRIVLDLSQNATANWSLGENNVLLIDVTAGNGTTNSEPALPEKSGKAVVVIDPGHGGRQSGAVSVTGAYEKDFNLAVGLKVKALLEQNPNIQTVITRQDDTELSLQQRVDIAKLNQADLFVSIHGNKFTTPVPNGIETLYTREASKSLAETLHKHVLPVTGLKDRGVKVASLHVTRETTMPAVLLELGFLSNPADEALMLSEAYQNQCAQAIVDGIVEYLSVTNRIS